MRFNFLPHWMITRLYVHQNFIDKTIKVKYISNPPFFDITFQSVSVVMGEYLYQLSQILIRLEIITVALQPKKIKI